MDLELHFTLYSYNNTVMIRSATVQPYTHMHHSLVPRPHPNGLGPGNEANRISRSRINSLIKMFLNFTFKKIYPRIAFYSHTLSTSDPQQTWYMYNPTHTWTIYPKDQWLSSSLIVILLLLLFSLE